MEAGACQWSGVAMNTESTFLSSNTFRISLTCSGVFPLIDLTADLSGEIGVGDIKVSDPKVHISTSRGLDDNLALSLLQLTGKFSMGTSSPVIIDLSADYNGTGKTLDGFPARSCQFRSA